MSQWITKDGVEFESWTRHFILLSSGEIKRMSAQRYYRLFDGKPANGDFFKESEVHGSGGKRWVKLAFMVVRTHLKPYICSQIFHACEVDPKGDLVWVESAHWLNFYSKRWKPSAAQVRAMEKIARSRKVRRPSLKGIPETQRFVFN